MLTLPSAGELLTSLTLFPLAFLASVELLRRGRWPWTVGLGVLLPASSATTPCRRSSAR